MLAAIAALLSERLRASDVVCRYGGEEFVVLLCDSGCDGAETRLEQLREQVGALRVQHGSQQLPPLTVSIGLAAFPGHALDGIGLIKAADAALYRAKEGGRNRVCVAISPRRCAAGLRARRHWVNGKGARPTACTGRRPQSLRS